MRLTDEQFNALLPYEKHFETAVKAKWARHPGISALDLIQDIYTKVTGDKTKLNKGCNRCVLNLLTDMGNIFLADLEERNRRELGEKSERNRREIGESEERKDVVKTEVKVKRGGRRKKTE